jgi:rubredoxin
LVWKHYRCFFFNLSHCCSAQRGIAVTFMGINCTAREDPRAAHESGVRVALNQQQLEFLTATTKQNDSGCHARLSWFALVELLSRSWCSFVCHLPAGYLAGHWPNLAAMSETATLKWMCEACGFIYDPEEGDPDGGIPAGTAFEDIPDTWYCPVCGARKVEFVPYED